MKFKIPEIKIRKPRADDERESVPAAEENDGEDDILDELEDTLEIPEQPEPERGKPHSRGMEISESQLRPIWAGEICFGLIMALAAIIIALVN